MDNSVSKKECKEIEEIQFEIESTREHTSPRPRKATMLKLQWLSERLRRCERIKRDIAAGTYNVSSTDVAKAILNMRDNEE